MENIFRTVLSKFHCWRQRQNVRYQNNWNIFHHHWIQHHNNKYCFESNIQVWTPSQHRVRMMWLVRWGECQISARRHEQSSTDRGTTGGAEGEHFHSVYFLAIFCSALMTCKWMSWWNSAILQMRLLQIICTSPLFRFDRSPCLQYQRHRAGRDNTNNDDDHTGVNRGPRLVKQMQLTSSAELESNWPDSVLKL